MGLALTQKRLAEWNRVPVRGKCVQGEETAQGGEQCTFISVSSSDELCNRPCEHYKWHLCTSTGGCSACPSEQSWGDRAWTCEQHDWWFTERKSNLCLVSSMPAIFLADLFGDILLQCRCSWFNPWFYGLVPLLSGWWQWIWRWQARVLLFKNFSFISVEIFHYSWANAHTVNTNKKPLLTFASGRHRPGNHPRNR